MTNVFVRLRHVDWLLVFAVAALVVLGLAAIYSVALSQPGTDFLPVKKQLIAVVLGFGLYALMAFSNFRLLRNYSVLLYVVACLLLISVLLFGKEIRGTTGWFDFGVFSFQPVEFVKVALAVALAAFFSKRSARVAGWRELLGSGAITAIPVGLTMMQPDFGSASLLLGMWGVLLLFAGLQKRYVISLFATATAFVVLAWQFFFKDYQRERILTFLDPSLDPLGQGYHVTQAIIAVGAGGWFGRGLGFGSQSQLKFLPESQTDFVFAVIAEELGFFGVLLLLGGFFLLFSRLYTYAVRTRDDFTGFLLVAVGAMLFVQCVINIGMNLGVLPVTGVTLPLVSYGGSSLIFTLWMLGIIQSVAIHGERGSQERSPVLE